MKQSFFTYKTIDNEILADLDLELGDYQFYYTDYVDGESVEFNIYYEYEGIDDSIKNKFLLSSKESNYNPDVHNLIIRNKVSIKNAFSLFGEDGVASLNTTLGLAISWVSKSSNQRGVLNIGEMNSTKKNYDFDYELKFNCKQIKGEVDIKLILYVKKLSSYDNFSFAKTIGTTIGELNCIKVFIDGIGSIFPIVTVNKPNEPLWMLDVDYDDPTLDLFNVEHVRIQVNQAHVNYQLLSMENGGIQESPLLREIICNSLSIIIMTIREDANGWESMLDKNYEDGSICAAIRYFIDNFNLDYDSINKNSYSIRKMLDKMINL